MGLLPSQVIAWLALVLSFALILCWNKLVRLRTAAFGGNGIVSSIRHRRRLLLQRWGTQLFKYRQIVVQGVRHRVRFRSKNYFIGAAQRSVLQAICLRYTTYSVLAVVPCSILGLLWPKLRLTGFAVLAVLELVCAWLLLRSLYNYRPASKRSNSTTTTLYIWGYHAQKWRVVINNSYTVADIMHSLRTRYALQNVSTHLYLSSRWLPLPPDARVGDLCLDELSQLSLRICLPGGSPSLSPAQNTRSRAAAAHGADSPSKNTRSRTRRASANPDSSEDEGTPSPVEKSPRRKRRKKNNGDAADDEEAVAISKMTDEEAWKFTDDQILAATRKSWSSKVYDHFNISLIRNVKKQELEIAFHCKHDPSHQTNPRPRLKTSHGTQNLWRSVNKCNKLNGHATVQAGQPTLPAAMSKYSPYKHRVIIALRCAVSRRPFNFVSDALYQEEVKLLNPLATIPSPQTVSRDVVHLHESIGSRARDYFKKHIGAVHVVVDGWTAPFVASYLGICLVWYANGRMWRTILEFKRLTERHSGGYLANALVKVLQAFGVADKLLAICADNATNNDTMVNAIAEQVPSFRGSKSRLRCFPHTVNLMAKAFLSLFFEPPATKKKKVTVKAGSKRKAPAEASDSLVSGEASVTVDVPEDAEGIHGADGIIGADEAEVDSGKAEHDTAAVKSVLKDALEIAAQRGIKFTAAEKKNASGLFTKVAGLARRVHDSAALRAKFNTLAGITPDDECDDSNTGGSMRSLARRVPTRWNSDLACLSAHIHFQDVVKSLIAAESELEAYALNPAQWELAAQLEEVLMIFEEPTELFSKADVPLVHQAVPMLEALESALCDIRDADGKDGKQKLPPIIRVAAIADLLIVGKYYAFTDDTEVYRIAMILCPNRKMRWFSVKKWPVEWITAARETIYTRWTETYEPLYADERTGHAAAAAKKNPKRSKWTRSIDDFEVDSAMEDDTLDAYLEAPPVPPEVITAAGGLLSYWEQQRAKRPRLARMALDFLTAPASSVDAERAFSGGRLQVNHMQHNISSQAFRAKMVLGSWYNAPWMPSVSDCAGFVGGKRGKTAAEKEKAQSMPDVIVID